MSYIQIENLTFAYPDGVAPVFEGLSANLDDNWRLGIVGKNGIGKTTFFRLLCGALKGEGKVVSNSAFHLFPCTVHQEELSCEEIAKLWAPDTEQWKIRRETNLLGLDEELFYRPFSTLSGGERTKLQLAVLFAGDGFPLLDEPTDHLDLQGRESLAEYLSKKRGFFVISHDRSFLDGCCDHIMTLSKSRVEIIQGNYSVWRGERDKKETNDAVQKEKLEKQRVQLSKSAARMKAWAARAEQEKSNRGKDSKHAVVDRGYLGAKAAKLQKRALVTIKRKEQAGEEIKQLIADFDERGKLQITALPPFAKRLVTFSDISVDFGTRTLFEDFSLNVFTGERIALTGGNGTGKSTLLKLLCGEEVLYTGNCLVSSQLKISYVPQLYHYTGTLKDYAAFYQIDDSYFKAILAKFGFERGDFSRDMRLFSEGQKKKAALARSLCERAHLYVWDEPLNYLDVSAREQLEEAVLSSEITLLFVEHDLRFVERVATRTVVLK